MVLTVTTISLFLLLSITLVFRPLWPFHTKIIIVMSKNIWQQIAAFHLQSLGIFTTKFHVIDNRGGILFGR